MNIPCISPSEHQPQHQHPHAERRQPTDQYSHYGLLALSLPRPHAIFERRTGRAKIGILYGSPVRWMEVVVLSADGAREFDGVTHLHEPDIMLADLQRARSCLRVNLHPYSELIRLNFGKRGIGHSQRICDAIDRN